MKKKVALLLVLTMILSMLPMNVFGNLPGLTLQPGMVLNPQPERSATPWTYQVTVNMEQLTTTGHEGDVSTRLEFALSGAAAGYLRFTRPVISPTNAGDSVWFNTYGATDPAGVALGAGAGFEIRVSPLSQLFYTHVDLATGFTVTTPVPNPETRFGSGFGDGTAAGGWTQSDDGRLSVVRGTDQRVEAWLNFTSGPAITTQAGWDARPHVANLSGTLVLEIAGIVANTDEPRINVNRVGRFGVVGDTARVPLITNGLLAFPTVEHGVNVTVVGDPVRFENMLILPALDIAERRPGSLTLPEHVIAGSATIHRHVIRLVGPRDYVWNVGIPGQLAGANEFRVTTRNSQIFTMVNPDGSAAPDGVQPEIIFTGIVGGRPTVEMVVHVSSADRIFPFTEIIGTMRLEGLMLAPSRHIGASQDIHIDVYVGSLDGIVTGVVTTWTPHFRQTFLDGYFPSVGGAPPVALPAALAALVEDVVAEILLLDRVGVVPPTEAEIQARINAVLPAANAGDITPDDVLVGWFPSTATQTQTGTGRMTERLTRWRERGLLVGVRAESALEITTYYNESEDELPVLISGIGSPTRTWPASNQTGYDNNTGYQHRTARVQIRELVPGSLNTALDSFVDFNFGPGVQLLHASWRLYNGGEIAGVNIGHWRAIADAHAVVTGDEEHPPILGLGVPVINSNSLRLFVPRDARLTANRTLEVYFFLSVEAGYGARHNGAPISVNVSGPSVVGLPGGSAVVDVAEVMDPISVRLLGAPVPAYIGQVMNLLEPTAIPNIVIEEALPGMLRRGSQFTVSLDAIPIAVLGNHALLGTQATVDTQSGLELRVVEIGGGTAIENAAVRFEVIRESVGTPATITLTNNHIMGTILPGIQYVVAINGGSVLPPNNIGQDANAIAQNTARGASGLGNFSRIPYYVEVVEFREFTYPGLPPGIGDPSITGPGDPSVTPGRPDPGVLRLYPGMARIFSPSQGAWVEQPVITHGGVTRIALRVFGDHIGADVMTMTAERVVVISGHAINGERMTVHLPVSSNLATIIYNDRGVTLENVDIANWVNQNSPTGASSGPFGSVQTVLYNNLTYLPARFLGYVFGFDVEWANQVTTMTPRR